MDKDVFSDLSPLPQKKVQPEPEFPSHEEHSRESGQNGEDPETLLLVVPWGAIS